MENQPEKKDNNFKPLTVLFPIGIFLILGVVNITKERKNDGTFLDSAGPWIGYICLALAGLMAIMAIVKFTRKK